MALPEDIDKSQRLLHKHNWKPETVAEYILITRLSLQVSSQGGSVLATNYPDYISEELNVISCLEAAYNLLNGLLGML